RGKCGALHKRCPRQFQVSLRAAAGRLTPIGVAVHSEHNIVYFCSIASGSTRKSTELRRSRCHRPPPYNGRTMRIKDGANGITAVFAVGVEAAQAACRPQVRHAAADATAFAGVFAALDVPPDRRVVLVDGTATNTTIESRLRTFSALL